MLSNPKRGQIVQMWYAKKFRELCMLHGKFGRVVIVGRGKPRNHGVEVDGNVYVVPSGNLRIPK